MIATVVIRNRDGDSQQASARLLRGGAVVCEQAIQLEEDEKLTYHLVAGFNTDTDEIITLEAETYDGDAQYPTMLALKVDSVVDPGP